MSAGTGVSGQVGRDGGLNGGTEGVQVGGREGGPSSIAGASKMTETHQNDLLIGHNDQQRQASSPQSPRLQSPSSMQSELFQNSLLMGALTATNSDQAIRISSLQNEVQFYKNQFQLLKNDSPNSQSADSLQKLYVAQQSLSQALAQVTDLDRQLVASNSSITSLHRKQKDLQAKLKDSQASVSFLQQQLEAKNRNDALVQRVIAEQAAKLDYDKVLIASLKERLDQFNKSDYPQRLEDKELEISRLISRMASMTEALSTEKTLEEVTHEIQTGSGKETWTGVLKSLQAENEALKAQIRDAADKSLVSMLPKPPTPNGQISQQPPLQSPYNAAASSSSRQQTVPPSPSPQKTRFVPTQLSQGRTINNTSPHEVSQQPFYGSPQRGAISLSPALTSITREQSVTASPSRTASAPPSSSHHKHPPPTPVRLSINTTAPVNSPARLAAIKELVGRVEGELARTSASPSPARPIIKAPTPRTLFGLDGASTQLPAPPRPPQFASKTFQRDSDDMDDLNDDVLRLKSVPKQPGVSASASTSLPPQSLHPKKTVTFQVLDSTPVSLVPATASTESSLFVPDEGAPEGLNLPPAILPSAPEDSIIMDSHSDGAGDARNGKGGKGKGKEKVVDLVTSHTFTAPATAGHSQSTSNQRPILSTDATPVETDSSVIKDTTISTPVLLGSPIVQNKEPTKKKSSPRKRTSAASDSFEINEDGAGEDEENETTPRGSKRRKTKAPARYSPEPY